MCVGDSCKECCQDIPDAFQIAAADIPPERKYVYSGTGTAVRHIFRHQAFEKAVFDFVVRERKRIFTHSRIVVGKKPALSMILGQKQMAFESITLRTWKLISNIRKR